MKNLVKKGLASVSEAISDYSWKIEVNRNTIESHKNYIESLKNGGLCHSKKVADEIIEDVKEQIATCEKKIAEMKAELFCPQG